MAAQSQRAPRADGEQTRNRILDAAEDLFSANGYSATSVRAIAQQAGVNLAAAHYHFGSKRGLVAAALHRHAEPINTERLALLESLLEHKQTPTVEEVMSAFFTPLAREAVTDGTLPRLIARMYGEPGDVARELLSQEFGHVIVAFVAALDRALPGVGETELRWRFNFVVGAMVQLLNFGAPPGMDESNFTLDERMQFLQAFCVAGLKQSQEAS